VLILLDVGNTSVTYGLYESGRFHEFGSCDINDIPKKFNKWSKSGERSSNNVILSSVVPKNTNKIKNYLSKKKSWGLHLAGKEIPVEIEHKYLKINRLGIDRRVNLWGASRIYKLPLLIIDYGTAVTVDYLDKNNVFLGGMIIPGPLIAYQALLARAALLPKKLAFPSKPGSFLGHSPEDCLATGILNGYAAMTDGLIGKFRNRYGNAFRVLATGGLSYPLRTLCSGVHIWDPQLSIKSLLLLYKEYCRKSRH